jgi:cytochrome oxidase Cu insertion factor (SCO1/SenC/PrrC family)
VSEVVRLRTGAAALAIMMQILAAPNAWAHDGSHGSRPGGKAGPVPADVHVGSHDGPAAQTLGGSFELVDHTGSTVTERSFRGQWMLIFFGYTGCREACPTGLVTMTKALEVMGPDADRVQPLFIDFSPEEPDLKGLAQFVDNFHPRLIGLTGTRIQISDAIRQFKIRREFKAANYSSKETGRRIDHTTYFYLIDPEGRTRAYFHHRRAPEEMAASIRRYVQG